MTHPTHQEIHSALLAAFRDEDELARMVSFKLGEKLNEIAGGKTFTDLVFSLLEWAEARGQTEKLIDGAIAFIPTNPELQRLRRQTPIPSPTEPSDPPKPAEPIQLVEPPYGTMNPASPLYVERRADNLCLQIVSGNNPFTVYGQAARQMGKSSLMQRMLHMAQASNCTLNVAYVDFEKFDTAQLADIDTFLQSLCYMIGESLKVDEQIEQNWASKFKSPLMKCSDYVFEHLVASVDGPVILAMDEVEKVLDSPFQDDFFGMLRTWHNDRARDENIARASLFLSSSTEPELFIENPNQSPFNVALPIELSYFNPAEVTHLNVLHGDPLTAQQVPQLHAYLNGHPYLTRQALYTLATTDLGYDQLVDRATTDDSPFKMHLQNLWRHIEERGDLRAALKQILRHGKHEPNRIYYRLKGAGLVLREGDQARMANQLYADYFGSRVL